MRITDILTESELDELSLAGVGRGIGKVVGGVGKAVGGVKGAIQGTKDAYNRGRQTSYNAARSNVSGQRRPATQPSNTSTPPSTPQTSNTSNPPAQPSNTNTPAVGNPFTDPTKLKHEFDAISQQLTAAQANQLKPIIQSIYNQLGGLPEGMAEAVSQKTFTVVYYSPKTDRNITKTIKADSESAVWDKLRLKDIDVISVKEQGVAEGSINQLPIVLYREIPSNEVTGREIFQVVKSQSPFWKVGDTFSDDDASMGSRQVRFKSVT